MSIPLAVVRRALDEGRLARVLPLDPAGSVRRAILVLPELQSILDADGYSGEDRERIIELRSDLDQFITGQVVTVGGWKDDSYMKPLMRSKTTKVFADRGVWEIRSIDPKPSIRILGLFADKDLFIGTQILLRKDLGGFGSSEWRQEIRRCTAEWRKMFPGYDPVTGGGPHDYISQPLVYLGGP